MLKFIGRDGVEREEYNSWCSASAQRTQNASLIIFHKKKNIPMITRLRQHGCAQRTPAAANPVAMGRCYLPHKFKRLVVTICAELCASVAKCDHYLQLIISNTHTKHRKPQKFNVRAPVSVVFFFTHTLTPDHYFEAVRQETCTSLRPWPASQ